MLLHGFFLAVVANYRGEEAGEISPLREKLAAISRENDDVEKLVKYEPNPWSRDASVLCNVAENQDRIYRALDSLAVASQQPSPSQYFQVLDPEFRDLSDALASGLQWMGDALARRSTFAPVIDLSAPRSKLEAKALALRKLRVSEQYELQDVLQFHAFLVGLQNLAQEIADTLKSAEALNGTPTK